jgi:hypothetical protein
LFGIWFIAAMASGDDWIKDVCENRVALFVAGSHADGLDGGMAGIVNTGLDALGKGTT